MKKLLCLSLGIAMLVIGSRGNRVFANEASGKKIVAAAPRHTVTILDSSPNDSEFLSAGSIRSASSSIALTTCTAFGLAVTGLGYLKLRKQSSSGS